VTFTSVTPGVAGAVKVISVSDTTSKPTGSPPTLS
jgi:hypothetical protein